MTSTVHHQLPNADLLSELKASLQAGRRNAIDAVVAELVRRGLRLGRTWRVLADVMVFNGEYTLAKAASALHLRDEGRAPAHLFAHATLLARIGATDEADRLLATLPLDIPDQAAAAFARGTLALNLGRRDAALVDLRRCIAAAPHSGKAWLALAMAADGSNTTIRDEFVAATPRMASVSPEERAQHRYGLGKLLLDAGRDAEARAAFSDAAAAMRMCVPYDRLQDQRTAREATLGFSRDVVRRLGDKVTVDTARPIIVTGLPRSGTTLVEQILASHSAVAGGEEFGRFGRLAAESGGASAAAVTSWAAQHGADAVANQYLHWLNERFGSDGRVIDKTPDASRYLLLLPLK